MHNSQIILEDRAKINTDEKGGIEKLQSINTGLYNKHFKGLFLGQEGGDAEVKDTHKNNFIFLLLPVSFVVTLSL